MRALPFVAFFFSGASSLIFQMIWSRLLHHVFGSSSVAISSVVSVFMGGLGLGAWLFGRFADRIRRPLLLYAGAELGVGAFALLVPLLLAPDGWLADVNGALRRELGAESMGFMLARFACIVPVLIVPTTLMGSTLPLLSRHFVRSADRSARASARVGTLYAINTVGAVAGVFVAGFVLMPRVGVQAANTTAVCMNFGLALGIVLLRRYLPPADAVSEPASVSGPEPEPESDAPFPRPVRVAAAVAFGLSGLCSLLYEVVWSRALVNTIGASVYAFALILMTFLIGIAGGSAIAAHVVAARARLLRGVAVACALLSAAALTPLSVRYGLWAWVVAVATASVALAGLLGLERTRERQLAGLDLDAVAGARVRHAATALLVPVACAGVPALVHRTRLEWIVLTVTLSAAALLALLLWLRRRVLLLLAAVQLFIAGATFLSDLWADEISLTFASMVAPLYEVLADSVDRVMALMFTTAALCVLPSALGMGAMFPLTMRVWSAGGRNIGREVGVVYTGNTVGSIVGAWLPGFVLMPTFGMQATLHAGIALNLLLGLSLLLVRRGEAGADVRGARGGLSVAAVVALALLYVATTSSGSPVTWNLTRMTLGVFRISLAKDVLDEEAWGEPDLVYYRDGLSTTVSVERWGRHYSLKNNGKVEASNGDDMPTQIMVSALPLLFHERGPRDLDVAIIGLGSGVTVGAALQFPIGSVDVVELERSVAEASRFFEDVNHLRYGLDRYPYIEMPRLELINDDGRNYLASTERTYDVIVSEPSNPWITGVSDLFTVDHFQVSKRKLRPGGVYCQWVQLYEMSPENVKIIYRTFASQFRHAMVFSAEDLSSDTILLGSDSPLPLDVSRLRRALALPRVAEELERAYIHSPHDVLARVLLSNETELKRYTQHERRLKDGRWELITSATGAEPCPGASCRREPAPLNTDDNALIEFAAPRDLIGFERYKGYLRSIYSESWPYGALTGNLRGIGEGEAAAAAYAQQAMASLAHGRKRETRRLLQRAGSLVSSGAAPEPVVRAREMWRVLGPKPRVPELRSEPPPVDPELGPAGNARLRAGYDEIMDWMARGEPERAAAAFGDIPSALLRHAGAPMALLEGYVLLRAGRHEDAIDGLEELARRRPEVALAHPELYFYLARAHDALYHFDKAVRNARAYLEARAAMIADAPPTGAGDGGAAERAPSTDGPGETPKLAPGAAPAPPQGGDAPPPTPG
ncbi:MAG: fused MFS/spermidine synthase [Myxococcales bacterium]